MPFAQSKSYTQQELNNSLNFLTKDTKSRNNVLEQLKTLPHCLEWQNSAKQARIDLIQTN
jgi:hypothetical protein